MDENTLSGLEHRILRYLLEHFEVGTIYKFRKGYFDNLPANLAMYWKTRGVKACHCRKALSSLQRKGLITVSFVAPDFLNEYLTING